MATRGYLSRRSKKPSSSSQKGHKKKKLPPWDNTISDLLVHKPTKEELRRRHELHQPVPRFLESPTKSGLETFKTPENTKDVRYLVLREIMHTNEKLQEALTYSDKKMSAVPDLFGDDPKKYRGFPNITCAPGHKQELNGSETVRKLAFMKEPSLGASNLDILSDTVMDGTALNDLSELQQNTDKNNNEVTSDNPQSERDLVNSSSSMQDSYPSPAGSTLLAGAPEIHNEGVKDKNPENHDVQTEEEIVHEKKIHKEDRGQKVPSKASSTAMSGLHDLREMVDNLEEELRMFEQETGRQKTSTSFVMKEKETFGGFTVSILHAITKLVGYLRDCESQRKTDLTLKQDIFHTLQQQQMFIDALTNEVICLQDENRKLQQELEMAKKTTEEQMTLIKRELYAVLKSREYETLSNDMTFLYDRQTSDSQAPLQDVVHTHGIRDNFEYLCATKDDFPEVPEYADSKDEDNSVTTAIKNHVEETTPRTSLQSETTLPPGNITTGGFQNHHVTAIKTTTTSDRAPQFDVQQKTQRTSTSLNNDVIVPPSVQNSQINNHSLHNDNCEGTMDHSCEKFPVNYRSTEKKSVRENNNDFTTPNTTSSTTSEVFTYYNPVETNTLGNEKLTSPLSYTSDKYIDDDFQRASVFIGRNQTTSPHRRRKQSAQSAHSISLTDFSPSSDVNPGSESKKSPGLSPVLLDRKLLPEKPGQERVVVRLPSMWQDDTGVERKSATIKQDVKQQSESGWFALSSHMDARSTTRIYNNVQ